MSAAPHTRATTANFSVADLSLAEWGRKEIAIAEGEMPASDGHPRGVRVATAAQGRAHQPARCT